MGGPQTDIVVGKGGPYRDMEPEAGVKHEEEHGRRLIVAGLSVAPLSSDGLSASPRYGHTRGWTSGRRAASPAATPLAVGRIVRQDRLSGLIHEYDRAAA